MIVLSEEQLDAMAAERLDLHGYCGYCQRDVRNREDRPDHRVTPILEGGRGVECRLRGDLR